MAIEFNCANCGRLLSTTDERAGATARCPSCDDKIEVPMAAVTLEMGAARQSSPQPTFSRAAFAETAPWQPPAPPPSSTAFRVTPPSCANCGRPTDLAATYCSSCGTPLFVNSLRPPRYAAFWRRTLAMFIDLTVCAVVTWVVGAIAKRSWASENNVFLLVWLVYHASLESSAEQATVGKRILGLAVCGFGGGRISFLRAALRTMAKIPSLIICGVGFLMPLVTPRKQALHDLMTDTYVVRR